jgi:hypothetical protein
MTINQALIDAESQRVLWACLSYWSTEPNPVDERAICYSWVVRGYKDRFGRTFHQSRLRHLVRAGLLTQDDTSRRGNRRYYRISNPELLGELLKNWNLN